MEKLQDQNNHPAGPESDVGATQKPEGEQRLSKIRLFET
jgi:hypothetical protein